MLVITVAGLSNVHRLTLAKVEQQWACAELSSLCNPARSSTLWMVYGLSVTPSRVSVCHLHIHVSSKDLPALSVEENDLS